MAKKKTTHPIHMHIPTKIGFAILAIVVMVYAIFLVAASNTSNQVQTTKSSAAMCYWQHNRLVCARPPAPTKKPH